MSSLYLCREGARLKGYGATTRGPKTVLKIEIEVTSPSVLGFLLEDLARMQQAQAPAPVKRRQPQRLLTDQRGRDE